jgi:ferredoxin
VPIEPPATKRGGDSSTGGRIGANFHDLVIGPSQPCRIRYRRRQLQSALRTSGPAEPRASGSARATDAKPFRLVCDLDLCQSHAVCMGEAPEVFRFGQLGKVSLIQEWPSPELRVEVEAAVKDCPTGTLRIEELPTGAEASNAATSRETQSPKPPARWMADPDATA